MGMQTFTVLLLMLTLLGCSAALSLHAQKLDHENNNNDTDDVPLTIYHCVEPFCSGVPPNLTAAIRKRAAPGMVVGAVNSSTGMPLFVAAAGRHTYNRHSANTTKDSTYDMASVSKIMGATTATAVLYQRGLLSLDDPVTQYLGAGFASKGKGGITIRMLLLHNAGYPPDPDPGYSDPSMCPNNKLYHPGQNTECIATIYLDLLYKQGLVNPPGKVFVYSDLSMITLQFIIGTIVQKHKLAGSMLEPCFDESNLVCQYNAFVRNIVWGSIGMPHTTFVPRDSELTPPEWYEYDRFRHQLVKGFVSDENCYAMGGICGHAGVFTTVNDALSLLKVWMYNTQSILINKTTMKLFTTVANLNQSSRALGWDTNDQEYRWCGTMSDKAFLHIGYTGTELCGDPVSGIATVILANGRHPSFHSTGMVWYRPQFNALINDLYLKQRPIKK